MIGAYLPGFEPSPVNVSPAVPTAPAATVWYGSSKSDEWYTPRPIIDAVLATMGGIDLDPCADPGRRVPAERHFTIADDGLACDWWGRVFLNPPYCGQQLGRWVRYLMYQLREGHVTQAITLTPARTDTRWFQYLWRANALCFVTGRVHFDGPDGPGPTSATFPTVLSYFGRRRARFATAFTYLGEVMYPRRKGEIR